MNRTVSTQSYYLFNLWSLTKPFVTILLEFLHFLYFYPLWECGSSPYSILYRLGLMLLWFSEIICLVFEKYLREPHVRDLDCLRILLLVNCTLATVFQFDKIFLCIFLFWNPTKIWYVYYMVSHAPLRLVVFHKRMHTLYKAFLDAWQSREAGGWIGLDVE